jgi:hypothetical protein
MFWDIPFAACFWAIKRIGLHLNNDRIQGATALAISHSKPIQRAHAHVRTPLSAHGPVYILWQYQSPRLTLLSKVKVRISSSVTRKLDDAFSFDLTKIRIG